MTERTAREESQEEIIKQLRRELELYTSGFIVSVPDGVPFKEGLDGECVMKFITLEDAISAANMANRYSKYEAQVHSATFGYSRECDHWSVSRKNFIPTPVRNEKRIIGGSDDSR